MLSDLAAGLAEQGMDVHMIASRQRYDNPAAGLPARERWRDVEIHRVWTSAFGRERLSGRILDYLTFYFSLPLTLWRLTRRGDVVVAKTDPPMVSLLAGLVAMLRGAILVNWLQDVFPEIAVSLGRPRLPRAVASVLRKLRNRSLRAAAMNVVIGERMAEYFVAQGLPAAKARVIPNWAHEHMIRPMSSAQSRMRQTRALRDCFVVGYSGNLGRAHDWETLFDAALRLADKPHIAFLIVGGGHGYSALKLRAEQAGLSSFHFQTYQALEELSDSMAASDLHLVTLLPALEGLIVPSKIYGIAAAERPIAFVGDTDGEVARLIASGNCGFSVEAGRGDLLASAILDLAADIERCRSQGRRARELLDTRFSRENAHREWHQLLTKLSAQDLQHANHNIPKRAP